MLHVIFLVNALPPKPLDKLQTLQVHMSYDVEDTGQRFVFVLDNLVRRQWIDVNFDVMVK